MPSPEFSPISEDEEPADAGGASRSASQPSSQPSGERPPSASAIASLPPKTVAAFARAAAWLSAPAASSLAEERVRGEGGGGLSSLSVVTSGSQSSKASSAWPPASPSEAARFSPGENAAGMPRPSSSSSAADVTTHSEGEGGALAQSVLPASLRLSFSVERVLGFLEAADDKQASVATTASLLHSYAAATPPPDVAAAAFERASQAASLASTRAALAAAQEVPSSLGRLATPPDLKAAARSAGARAGAQAAFDAGALPLALCYLMLDAFRRMHAPRQRLAVFYIYHRLLQLVTHERISSGGPASGELPGAIESVGLTVFLAPVMQEAYAFALRELKHAVEKSALESGGLEEKAFKSTEWVGDVLRGNLEAGDEGETATSPPETKRPRRESPIAEGEDAGLSEPRRQAEGAVSVGSLEASGQLPLRLLQSLEVSDLKRAAALFDRASRVSGQEYLELQSALLDISGLLQMQHHRLLNLREEILQFSQAEAAETGEARDAVISENTQGVQVASASND